MSVLSFVRLGWAGAGHGVRRVPQLTTTRAFEWQGFGISVSRETSAKGHTLSGTVRQGGVTHPMVLETEGPLAGVLSATVNEGRLTTRLLVDPASLQARLLRLDRASGQWLEPEVHTPTKRAVRTHTSDAGAKR